MWQPCPLRLIVALQFFSIFQTLAACMSESMFMCRCIHSLLTLSQWRAGVTANLLRHCRPTKFREHYLLVYGFSNPSRRANDLQWFYLAQLSYKGAIWPSKISILFLYNRVFGDSTHQVTSFGIRLRVSVTILITFATSFFLISEIVTIFTCLPVQRYWDKKIAGTCNVHPVPWWYVTYTRRMNSNDEPT